jgi:NitT/TauT family transport system substrate-binding protein
MVCHKPIPSDEENAMQRLPSLLSCNALKSIAAAIAAALLLAPAHAADKIVMGEQPALTAMVSSVGIAKGFFAAEGLEVTQVFGERPTDTIPAALAGKIDFGYSGSPPLLAATSSGAPLVAIGLFSHGYSGILVASKANSKAKSLADFRGKRIGMQRGTGVTNVFLIALEKEGLRESDFSISNLRIPDMPTAMQGGSFDAVLGWEPNMSRIVAMGFGEKVITSEQFEEIAGVTYAFPLFTTREMVTKRPDVVQRFMNAWAKAQYYANAHHAESLQILRKTLGDAVKHTSDAELESLAYVYRKDRVAFTPADMKDIELMRDFMFKDGQIKQKLALRDFVDNAFAEKADRKAKSQP